MVKNLPSRIRRRVVREWDGHVHTTIFKMDNHQRPPVEHRELCLMLHDGLDRRGVWERTDTCIRMAESLQRLPQTATTLL